MNKNVQHIVGKVEIRAKQDQSNFQKYSVTVTGITRFKTGLTTTWRFKMKFRSKLFLSELASEFCL